MESYYAQRAPEYDRIYLKPERQNDLRKLEEYLSKAFAKANVLEIACGTGYWTRFIARSASSVLATDFNMEVMEIARQREYLNKNIRFLKADAFSLNNVKGEFNGGFCGFWWSHIPRVKTELFLKTFHSRLARGSRVIMIDNRYVEGSSTPVSRTNTDGDTYQNRVLDNGTAYEVLKNFPSPEDLRKSLTGFATGIEVKLFEYFWLVNFTVGK